MVFLEEVSKPTTVKEVEVAVVIEINGVGLDYAIVYFLSKIKERK